MIAPRRRTWTRYALLAGMFGAMSSSAAEVSDQTPPRWVVEPEARVGAAVTLGEARWIFHEALGLGVGATVRRSGSAWRGRGGLAIEPVTDVGPGASLAIFRARLGVEREWYRHPVTALDFGGAVRRLSTDELTRSALGVEAAAELGWRTSVSARWSLAASLRYSVTWFTPDAFLWRELGVSVTLGRTSVAPGSPTEPAK